MGTDVKYQLHHHRPVARLSFLLPAILLYREYANLSGGLAFGDLFRFRIRLRPILTLFLGHCDPDNAAMDRSHSLVAGGELVGDGPSACPFHRGACATGVQRPFRLRRIL